MKLISLNTWGGRGGLDNLLTFFKTYQDTDIFCLQEIWNGGEEMVGQKAGGSSLVGVSTTLLTDISKKLPDHRILFHPHFHDYYGLASFVKKDFSIVDEGDIFVYKEKGFISPDEYGNHARNIQYMTIQTPKGLRTVVNFHGIWNGKGKGDSADRLTQSANIVSFVTQLTNPYIITGDFNLTPETQSLAVLENTPTRNLIKEYGITSTRTNLYKKPEKFADYTLTHPDIQVHDFKTLPEEVSDHAALQLIFE